MYLATAVLFLPAVGVGVLFGRSTLDRRPLDAEQKQAEAPADRSTRWELVTCQDKLAARSRASTAAAAGPGDAGRDGAGGSATVESLDAELRRCKKSELLVSAEVCAAAGRQFEALMALPKDGLLCGPKARAADLVEENLESCAAFGDIPADFRWDDFTKEEQSVLAEASRVHRVHTEEEVIRHLKDFVWWCTMTSPDAGAKKL